VLAHEIAHAIAEPAVQRKVATGAEASAQDSAPLHLAGGKPLPEDVRDSMEHAFGADFSDVSVQETSQANAISARAFTRGEDLGFAPGELDTTTAAGRELLGHELAHVVQQRAGRVDAAAAHGGAGIVMDPVLEAEADALGARAARGEVVGSSPGASSKRSDRVQRQIACNDPGSNTAGWQMAEWGGWLDVRGMNWADVVNTGLIVAPVPNPLPNPPAAARVKSLAQHELLGLQRDPAVHNFATLADVHTEVARRTAATIMSMVGHGVSATDLDVALDMYGRLDGRGPADIAVLHKLEWHDAHNFQYGRAGVDAQQASQQGLVYGPWRGAGGLPTDNAGGGDANVHTMPLNVVWLLACCHHGVRFQLFAPPTERGLFRKPEAEMVENATTGDEQRKLSALARELMAVAATGLYNVVTQNDPAMPPGFQTTWLLTPNPGAIDATMAQLSTNNNDVDLPQLTAQLLPSGIAVIPPGSPQEAIVNTTNANMAQLPNREHSLRDLSSRQAAQFSAARVNLIQQREAQIMQITGEPVHVMRRRVLGTVAATFQCNYVTQPGQRLYVVGSLEEMGAWSAARALPLTFGGGSWEAVVSVCKDQTIRYKYLLEDAQGRHWEVGNDHVRTTAVDARYQDNWGGG